LIEFFDLAIGTCRNECGHGKGAANRCTTTADAAPSVPLTTFSRMPATTVTVVAKTATMFTTTVTITAKTVTVFSTTVTVQKEANRRED